MQQTVGTVNDGKWYTKPTLYLSQEDLIDPQDTSEWATEVESVAEKEPVVTLW